MANVCFLMGINCVFYKHSTSRLCGLDLTYLSIYGHNLVLKPYLQASKHNSNDANILHIQQLESLLEQNAEQRETLHKLMGQGYIDQILYTQENNALLSQADGYRQDIEVLNQFMSGSSTRIYETERLLHFCEHEDTVALVPTAMSRLQVMKLRLSTTQNLFKRTRNGNLRAFMRMMVSPALTPRTVMNSTA